MTKEERLAIKENKKKEKKKEKKDKKISKCKHQDKDLVRAKTIGKGKAAMNLSFWAKT